VASALSSMQRMIDPSEDSGAVSLVPVFTGSKLMHNKALIPACA